LREGDPIAFEPGAVEDDEGVFPEVLELRPLTELAVVLDRQRMEAEDLPQRNQVVLGRILEVEPEEFVAPQQVVDLRAVQRRQHAHGCEAIAAAGRRRCYLAPVPNGKRRGCPGRSSAPSPGSEAEDA